MLSNLVTRWDARVLARSSVVAVVAFGVAWLVTAVTDEGGVAWLERVSRTLPLAPVCAALGVWAALAPVRARGEARALLALGRSPAQVGAAAMVGGAAIAVLAAAFVGASRSVDIADFYPMVTHPSAWQWRDDRFVDRVHGLEIAPDGSPVRLAQVEGRTSLDPVPPHGRLAAALAMAGAGMALPMLVAQALLSRSHGAGQAPQGGERAGGDVALAVIAGVAVVSSVLIFQAAAARYVPALAAVLPPLGLLAFAARRYLRAS